MKVRRYGLSLAVAVPVVALLGVALIRPAAGQAGAGQSRLAVVWSSGDADVAHKVCFMYTQNAKKAGWFDQVTLIIWGPSSRLLAGDEDLQRAVKAMMADGVRVQACVVCADMYGVAGDLRELGIEVKGMGRPLSEMLKSDWKVLTF